MVFFTCNACGSSLKKNQVEKHYRNECRNCNVLSCMDCGQDFYGDDYANHTKCISEAEKYQGAMYKAPESKGDSKQEAWLERAREAMKGARVSSKVSGLLSRISEYPNIPRKKKKFENFVRNSCNVRDQGSLDELWMIFNTESPAIQVVEETAPHNDPTDGSGNITDNDSRLAENGGSSETDRKAEEEESGEAKLKRKKKRVKTVKPVGDGSKEERGGERNGLVEERLEEVKEKMKQHVKRPEMSENETRMDNEEVTNGDVDKPKKKRKLDTGEQEKKSKRQKMTKEMKNGDLSKHKKKSVKTKKSVF